MDMSVTYEQLRRLGIEHLRRLPPGARIVVRDRVFSPEQLIAEVVADTVYGRTWLLMFAKQSGLLVVG
jgi:hypothetical protein